MSNSHSDQIKKVDHDEAAEAELQEFCDLINEIERGPDAEERLARAMSILKLFAGGKDVDFVLATERGYELTEAEAGELANKLFSAADCCYYSQEADDLVGVVAKIIHLLTYGSLTVREQNGSLISLALYTKTADCANRATTFAVTAAE